MLYAFFYEISGSLFACFLNSSCSSSVLERTEDKPVHFTFHLHLEPATYADVLPTYRCVSVALSAIDTHRYGFLFKW